jgi:sigma-E factor negative regulatory protein RseB
MLCIAALPSVVVAQDSSRDPADGMGWLRRAAAAAQQLSYSGVFVYQHGSSVESSRIAQRVDSSGRYEKLEALSGPPREIVRQNGEVTCYFPDAKVARIEKGQPRRFPAVLPDEVSGIAESYHVIKGDLDRVAGYDCRVTRLEPKDKLRYQHSICVELASGLPLRAGTYDENRNLVEMFAFSQVAIGGKVSRSQVKSRYNATGPGWRLDRSEAGEGPSADTGWVVSNPPAGFRKILETRRMIQGRSAAHIVLSDGIAAISVFVEPAVPGGAKVQPESLQQGAINVYSRMVADHLVRTLGDAPSETIRLIGNSVAARSR